MNGYELSRKWFDFCFINPEKVTPLHTALYMFSVEHCNRLGWKEKFGLPTEMTKEALGVKSWHTYIKAFNDLVDWNFFTLIQRSKNQYSSNIIALSNFDEALDEAYDKALSKHISKHISKQLQSNDSIIKLITNNIELLNKNEILFENFIEELKNKEQKDEELGGEPKLPHQLFGNHGIEYTESRSSELEHELENNFSQHESLVTTALNTYKLTIVANDVIKLIPSFITHLKDTSQFPIKDKAAKIYFGNWFKLKIKDHVNGNNKNRTKSNNRVSDDYRRKLADDLQAGINQAVAAKS